MIFFLKKNGFAGEIKLKELREKSKIHKPELTVFLCTTIHGQGPRSH